MNFPKASELNKQLEEDAKIFWDKHRAICEKYPGKYRGELPEFHEELLAHEKAGWPPLKKIQDELTAASVITDDERAAFLKDYDALVKKHHLQHQDCGDYCWPDPCIRIAYD